jgi:hypothetical protein
LEGDDDPSAMDDRWGRKARWKMRGEIKRTRGIRLPADVSSRELSREAKVAAIYRIRHCDNVT